MNKSLKIALFCLSLLFGFSAQPLGAESNDLLVAINESNNSVVAQANDLRQAKLYYQQEQYPQAIAILKSVINQSQDSNETLLELEALVNLSLIYLKTQQLDEVEANTANIFSKLPQISDEEQKHKIENFALEIKGQLELNRNQLEQSIKTWQKSSQLAYSRGEFTRYVYAQSKQIEALQLLGLYGRAFKILAQIEPQLAAAPANEVTAQAWRSMANISLKLGDLPQAQKYIEQALDIAKRNDNQELIADILISQGDIALTEYQFQLNQNKARIPTIRNIQNIVDNYQESQSLSSDQSSQLTAQLKELNTIVYFQQNINPRQTRSRSNQYIASNSERLITNISEQINRLPSQYTLVNQKLIYAESLLALNPQQYRADIIEQLTNVLQQSDRLNYPKGKSQALGILGKLYQQSEQLEEAKDLTQQALYVSETILAPELAYQWQWQLGQIYKQMNDRQQAIVAYSGAVNTLSSLRRELVGINANLQFSFRDNIEPVYRQLVALALESNPTQQELQLARDTIEGLQIAELDNYFRDACLDVQEINLDTVIDEQTAVFYPILLEDRIEVIVSFGNQSLTSYSTDIGQDKVEQQIEQLVNYFNQETIAPINTLNNYLSNLYDYLVAPIREELNSANIQNLVFIGDGSLKKIPVTALYDGQEYLVENFNVAIAPSLKLVEYETVSSAGSQALLAGLGELNPQNSEAEFFNPLENVQTELESIQSLLPQTQVILDQSFTEEKLEEQIQISYPEIVHIATHGVFSSELENTFLLTWDDKINLQELSSLFTQYQLEKQAIDLLILSACQTALGDKKAALGLAGVGIKAGARTTVASLWYVDDQSTSLLMSNFYQQLFKNNTSKANALRQAQLAMINSDDYNHPYYWSAFILIGNWL